MKLSKTERLMLVNQYLFLEKLYPEQAGTYVRIRKVLEDGYELEYCEMFNNICLDDQVLSQSACVIVRDILSMFTALKYSYNQLDDKSDIEPANVTFWGFDADNETKYMAYARYLIEECRLWGNLQEDAVFNSHVPNLSRYQQMLITWNSYEDEKYLLSKKQILNIIEND